tara:strand:+ start:12373 stop:12984 length:612 start_codon:yes stop_codon:yes gene_type:complete
MTSNFMPAGGSVARLIDAFSRLPGIGPKTAQRLTYHLIRASSEESELLAKSLLEMRDRLQFCSLCHNISESTICPICANTNRDQGLLCVVEEPLDLFVIERASVYQGLYHVLHGVISPMNGVGPEDLKIQELIDRVKDGKISEVLVATNLSLEGDATAMYLHDAIDPLGVRTTRLAGGLPSGGDLEYADEVTLSRALEGRREL